MFQDRISDYFEGVSAKYLSAVDARPEKSNQHEIGGLVKVGFDRFLGRPGKGQIATFRARMAYLRDEDESPVVCEDKVTWYDARHAGRGPEYRLYYKTNEVTAGLCEGDFCLVGKLHDGSLLLVFSPAGSTTERQLRAIFGIDDVTSTIRMADLNAGSLLLPLRLILEDIGLVFSATRTDDDTWLERILSIFGDAGFPATSAFSEFARKSVEEPVNTKAAADAAILAWMSHEERLFRILERHVVKHRLQQGFGTKGDDVDAFVEFSLSVQNRRKSRVGRAFENHLAQLFTDNGLHFEQGGGKNVTENNSKPDFMFPGFAAYKNSSFPASSLRLLGAKTTCKARWRQVLAEGNRIPSKHLITLEAAISEPQTDEMRASGLHLVVPAPVQATYSPAQQAWLVSVSGFIDEVKDLQKRA
jgi:hypothetical protein